MLNYTYNVLFPMVSRPISNVQILCIGRQDVCPDGMFDRWALDQRHFADWDVKLSTAVQPSWSEGGTTRHNFERGPSKDHSTKFGSNVGATNRLDVGPTLQCLISNGFPTNIQRSNTVHWSARRLP
jgi:hypothetical protein